MKQPAAFVTTPPKDNPVPEGSTGSDEATAPSAGPLSSASVPSNSQVYQLDTAGPAGTIPVQPTFPPMSQFVVQQVQTWQSPYPPPEHIKEYEKILPGTFDRILKMAEQAQAEIGRAHV